MKDNLLKRIIKSHRLYWLLGLLLLPVIAEIVAHTFNIGCRCPKGSVTRKIYWPIIWVIAARMGVGLFLGEKRRKIIIYLLFPLACAYLIIVIGAIMGWQH